MEQTGTRETDPAILPAVILAAGRGERLQGETEGSLKPLTSLHGITLLERTALACQTAGVTDCYIVVGYGQAHMTAEIAELTRRYRMRLHAVPNPDWEEGNGTSVLAVEPYMNGPFLLLMCDHVFDITILPSLLTAAQTSEASLLAVDDRMDQIFDLDDATKVQLNGHAITAIGKELPVFDAVDTGLFHCRPAIFQALKQARDEGDGSLSGGIRGVIAKNAMQAVAIGDRFWMDIDTAASLAHAEQMLMAHVMTGRET